MKNKLLQMENEEQIRQTICFSDKIVWPYQKQDINFDFSGKSRMKIIASEVHWWLPSSPIVKKKHVLSLCKLAKCKNHLWLQ